jgi:uncharacterized membrane protein
MHIKPMYGEGMHDPVWIKSLLGVHNAARSTAFLMAPLALASAKGGKAHRRWGKIYFWAMAVVGSTALVLALYRPILFLALVAVFSFYAAFSAYRVLFHKNLPKGQKVTWPDWAAAIITFVHGGWVIWVLPTVIGSPAIAWTTVYYRRKFTPRTGVGMAPKA